MRSFGAYLIVAAAALLAGPPVAAHAETNACYCEIGDEPVSEQGFFRAGCEIWLTQQKNCTSKQIVPQNHSYMNELKERPANRLTVGYVGHWASSQQMVRYLETSILPTIDAHGISVTLDNTACRAMNDLFLLQSYMTDISLPQGKELVVRGNQAISVGLWDIILGKSHNFQATLRKYSQNRPDIVYPLCKTYEGKPCLKEYQGDETAICLEGKNRIVLSCAAAHSKVEQNDPYVKFNQRNRFVWKRSF